MQTTTVIAKPFWKSWTVGFNILAGAGVLIDWMMTEGFAIVENPIFAGVVTLVNLALRFKTDKPVAASEKAVQVTSGTSEF
jgi:hypothetical protein